MGIAEAGATEGAGVSRWSAWTQLRVQYRLQAMVSDLLALILGILIGWYLL